MVKFMMGINVLRIHDSHLTFNCTKLFDLESLFFFFYCDTTSYELYFSMNVYIFDTRNNTLRKGMGMNYISQCIYICLTQKTTL